MYDDHPADRCFYGMLEGMYETHSIRRNICGSVASISEITAELLYQCYHAFYRLSNMALVVCGDVTDEAVLRIADEVLPSAPPQERTICLNENDSEPAFVYESYREQAMQVSKPLFNIGIKDVDIPADGRARQKKDAAMAILDEMLFSRGGELYRMLIERDMISPALSYGYTISESCAYNSIAGEADDPRAVLQEIRAYLEKVKDTGLSREDFVRGKRVMYAEFVKSFDSTDSIANNLFSFICEDCDLLSYAELVEEITFEDVCELFTHAFDEEKITLSVILPLK
jgi:predicted Zn-dependent peptidase